ncbi:hypothetical protein pb186bvf_012834 [Paramecium bursaria]
MSFDHINQSSVTSDHDKSTFQEQQLNNMYDKEKFVNPHDIAGQNGLVMAQQVELEKKKVQFRVSNEEYLRKHPELEVMLSVFLFKVLEEKPQDLLAYAGKFFDEKNLEEIIQIQKRHYLGI